MLSYWMQTVENKTVLEQRTIDIPTPGPKQILVRLHAASLNRGEFVIGHGLHKGGQASPVGIEGAGVVSALGNDVKGIAVGDKVIGTSGSPEKLARLKEHGLDLALCLRGSGFEGPVMEATGGKGAKLVVDTVGGSVFAESIRCMAFEARFAMVGYVDGVLSAELDLLALHSKRLRLFGVSNKLRSADQRAEFLPQFKAEVLPAIADGRIKPLVDHAFAFEQLAQAKEMMETNKHVGKIVLRMPV